MFFYDNYAGPVLNERMTLCFWIDLVYFDSTMYFIMAIKYHDCIYFCKSQDNYIRCDIIILCNEIHLSFRVA